MSEDDSNLMRCSKIHLSAYGSFVKFFEEKVEKDGVSKTLETYVFGSQANENNVNMLVRLLSGA